MTKPVIVDLFAGPGGWSIGLNRLGLEDIGVESDKDVAATRDALGLKTIVADVRDVSPSQWSRIDGLIASPPCQTFSQAGKQMGLEDMRGELIYEPMRFIEAHLPTFVAMEEVPPVMTIWNEYCVALSGMGYKTWAGITNAADYGVPQSRKRAFFFATRNGVAPAPNAGTHSKDASPGDLFGFSQRRWVTVAEALPEKKGLPGWAYERPSTTIVRSFCPHVVSAPGYRKKGDGPRQNAPGSFEVTIDEMAVLQGGWAGMPFCGSKTKKFSICGALLPPPWAECLLRHLVSAFTSVASA